MEYRDDPWGGSYGSDPRTGGMDSMSYSGDPWGGESMEERMLERRAQRMYQGLAEQGKFGQIDKAKRDKNYRNYLLQNYEEDEFF